MQFLRRLAITLVITTASVAQPVSRQLLLDERVIARVDNARLSVGTVRKHGGNPLFGEDKSWEVRFDNLYANVLHDETDGLFKCWYSPFIADRSAKGMTLAERNSSRYTPPPGREMGVCYAVSQDGLKWEKPELNLVEFGGSRANNLVLRGPHGAGVFKDLDESDSSRRYKMFHARDALRFSADGLHWSDPMPLPGVESRGDTHNNLLRAQGSDQFVGFVRLRDGAKPGQRTVGRTESDDLKRWTKAVEVLRGDEQNQTYSMPVFRHAGIYLGLVAVFRTREDRVHTELAWSPDTLTWHRIQPGTPFIGNSPNEGDYDWGCVYAAAVPVTLGHEIRIYYGGSDGRHTGWRNGSLCLATLRPDGWAGYEPINADQAATILTAPVVPDGATLFLTADVAPGGSIRVAIEGDAAHSLTACVPITANATDAKITWRAGQPFGASPVVLRFELTRAKLYSFRFAE